MEKPLGHKSYGSIAHLPGSRQGRDDIGINPGHARICLERKRDKYDVITVLEKLDGTNVSVAKIDNKIVPLTRSGYKAIDSPWKQHHMFHDWVGDHLEYFYWLNAGERLCGEWLAQAHGTRYKLFHDPFVAFDIMKNGHIRSLFSELEERKDKRIVTPHVLWRGDSCSIKTAMERLGEYGYHGAIDKCEGAVWRVERNREVDFLAKYVRTDKIDGKYLFDENGNQKEPLWNWNKNG